ncbi:virus coat protein VP2 [Pyrobaculum spherical virus 2]|uniref:Virus coat protein VP2 n=1 Tax=Pyrobaculum spherical virus 2 TaxID=2730632 RepID=A0A6M3VY50_9VIRU|nr:virus coat protein VP2 [Pyrobaculum spherical virus 2]QJF12426.1 virus coat protein VP2 [Pyrobaculum spherical virus 2]
MMLPPGTGLLGLIAIGIFNRRAIPIALITLFVSGALAAKAPQYYAYFTPLIYSAIALYALRQEERVIERVIGLLLGLSIIWGSDNAAIADALRNISITLITPFFKAVYDVLGLLGFGVALTSLLAWSLLSPRLMALEEPLLAMGYVVLGFTLLSGIVNGVPDYLRLALAIALLNQFSRALRGNLEALGEVAPVLFLLGELIPATQLTALGAVVAIIELALGILNRKHLAGSAMWATAITLV